MTAAYLIHVDPESGYGDLDGMAQYNAHVGAIIESFGGVYHLRHKRTRVLEGRWRPEFITLIEFPSMGKLLAFYESEEYRPWLDLRKNAGEGNIVVIESGAPDYRSPVTRDDETSARTPQDLLPMIAAAINAGDPAEVVKYFDDEGCFVLPDGALVRGHAELQAMYERRLALKPEITTQTAKVIQAGDVALVTNVWSTRLRNGEIDGKDSFEGVATLVLRRNADGRWRILVDST